MPTKVTPPAWLTVGATVYQLSYAGSRLVAYPTTVERFTATQVVLANGERFKLPSTPDTNELSRSGATTWDPPHRLVAADHPHVAIARAHAAVHKTRARVALAYRNAMERAVTTVDDLDKLTAAIAAYRAQLDAQTT